MLRSYQYVGPKKIAQRLRDAPKGIPVFSADDVLLWMGKAGQELSGAGEIVVTFVIDDKGALLIADRRSEHVACAGGMSVLSAGEITFRLTMGRVLVARATNQSTGYCPEPDSWPAVKGALQTAGIQSPSGFDPACVFRLCECCNSISIIKEGVFECEVCSTALPAEWNLDRMPKSDLKVKRTGGLSSKELQELAKKNRPPQSWYDEDFEGLT